MDVCFVPCPSNVVTALGETGWKLVSFLPSLSNVVTALANGARGAKVV